MRHFSDETRERMSVSAKRRFAEGRNDNLIVGERALKGPDHYNWSGEDISRASLHEWLRDTYIKTGVCRKCGKKGKTDWANLSGKYRRSIYDFLELCRSCHSKMDNKIMNIHHMKAKLATKAV